MTHTMTNFFVQADRAAEMMQARDQEMIEAIEKMQAEGYSLKSLSFDHYEFG